LKSSHSTHEKLVDIADSPQGPHLIRAETPPTMAAGEKAGRILLGTASAALGLVGITGVVFGLGLMGWLAWAVLYN
jgi:hypothetical protein